MRYPQRSTFNPQPVILPALSLGRRRFRVSWPDGTAARVAEALKKIGYAHVTLDLQGYRRGSTNEALVKGA